MERTKRIPLDTLYLVLLGRMAIWSSYSWSVCMHLAGFGKFIFKKFDAGNTPTVWVLTWYIEVTQKPHLARFPPKLEISLFFNA